MSVTGIISEYNPFHNGHKYLIDERRRRCTGSYFIAVMSGNFTQRGEAAVLNKWQRAELAVYGGADLVLELPFIFAVNSAQYFAQGAVSLLKRIGCADAIAFGSEYADEKTLRHIARQALSGEFPILLKKYMQSGASYAAAAAEALNELTGADRNILKAPNAILGIEYLKACEKYNAPFSADVIERIKAGHNEKNLNPGENFASGTAIRSLLYEKSAVPDLYRLRQFMPEKTFLALFASQKNLPQEENLFLPLAAKLRLSKTDDLKSIYGVQEGIEHKLILASGSARSRLDFLQKIKSKRYPLSSLQRLLLYLLLDLKKEQANYLSAQGALYARILAFNEKGAYLLRQMKKTSSVPLINKTSEYLNGKKRCRYDLTALEKMLSLDTYATDLYNLCFAPPQKSGMDFTASPKYVGL